MTGLGDNIKSNKSHICCWPHLTTTFLTFLGLHETLFSQTNILQFAWWKCKAKKGLTGHWERYGPCYVLMLSTCLVLVQPTMILVVASYSSDDEYTPCPTQEDPDPETVVSHHGMQNLYIFFDGDDDTALTPNTLLGWAIQIFGTYLGFILMFWGVTWATNLDKKIAKKWNALRGRM